MKTFFQAIGAIAVAAGVMWALWFIVQASLIFYAFYKGGHPG